MSTELYAINFPDGLTAEQLHELFSQQGDVISLHIDTEEKTGMRYAVVQMASEKMTTRAHRNLNEHKIDRHYLAVSYLEVNPKALTSKQRKAIEEILATLEETEKVPVRQIEMMVRLCGLGFVQTILQEALEIESGDGIMTSDGSQRRTKGGVFFYIARYRMSPPVRRIIFNRKGKLPVQET